jgi:hypothetical protein
MPDALQRTRPAHAQGAIDRGGQSSTNVDAQQTTTVNQLPSARTSQMETNLSPLFVTALTKQARLHHVVCPGVQAHRKGNATVTNISCEVFRRTRALLMRAHLFVRMKTMPLAVPARRRHTRAARTIERGPQDML